jgi:hypothetical protein
MLLRTSTVFTTSTIYRTLCAMLYALCGFLLATDYVLLDSFFVDCGLTGIHEKRHLVPREQDGHDKRVIAN